MKKIVTLMLSTLITMAVFADHRPIVTLKSARQYEIVIDGKSYFSHNGNIINIADLSRGKHVVKVYEVDNRTIFRTTRKLVSSTVFSINKKDVSIVVDIRGNVKVTEAKSKKYRKNGRNYNWDDHRKHRH